MGVYLLNQWFLKHLPHTRLLYWISDAERIIASAAKATLSPRGFEDLVSSSDSNSIESWIRELIARGHGSPLEHSIYIFEVICSRVCSHQLVRHRHASYSQLSQRYSDKYLRGMARKACEILGLDHIDDYGYYVEVFTRLLDSRPGFEKLLDVVSESYIIPPAVIEKRDKGFLEELVRSTIAYYRALVAGLPYEDARYLLPQGVKTRLVVSMNARELVEVFLPLRMCTRAQWEIRMIAWRLWEQLMKAHPSLFKHTGPRCVLMENRVKGSPCTLRDYLEEKCKFTIERCPEKIPREKIYECIKSAHSTH